MRARGAGPSAREKGRAHAKEDDRKLIVAHLSPGAIAFPSFRYAGTLGIPRRAATQIEDRNEKNCADSPAGTAAAGLDFFRLRRFSICDEGHRSLVPRNNPLFLALGWDRTFWAENEPAASATYQEDPGKPAY